MVKKTKGFMFEGSRYTFDFGMCRLANGWAQMDTRKDSGSYGVWTQPFERKIVSYCEGDVHTTECDTDDEYMAELTTTVQWHKDHELWIGIDIGSREDMRERLEELGVAGFLHPDIDAAAPVPANAPVAGCPAPDGGMG